MDSAIRRSGRGEEPSGESPPPDSRSALVTPSLQKISPTRQTNSPQLTNQRFQFQKRRQLIIRTHHETPSIIAMCVNDEDRPPVGINRGDAAPTKPGFAEIVGDYFPIVQLRLHSSFMKLMSIAWTKLAKDLHGWKENTSRLSCSSNQTTS